MKLSAAIELPSTPCAAITPSGARIPRAINHNPTKCRTIMTILVPQDPALFIVHGDIFSTQGTNCIAFQVFILARSN